MDFDNIACVRIAGSCTEILVFVGIASTTATDYDTILARIFEVFDAKESNQSNIQVSHRRSAGIILHKSLTSSFSLPHFHRRSSQQIYNVTLFFLFFMSLYGLLGVQFFGELKNHCVLNTTNEE